MATPEPPGPASTHPSPSTGASRPWATLITMLVATLIVGVALFAWHAREAILLAFAASIVAVILLAVSDPIERWTGLSRRWSIPLAGLLLVVVVGSFFFLIGSELAAQLSQLRDALPNALQTLREQFGIDVDKIGSSDGNQTSEASGPSGSFRSLPDIVDVARSAIGNIMSAGSMVINALASFVVVVVGGAYLAHDPDRYRRGLVMLFPEQRQPQADSALRDCGHALHRWLLAQLLSMTLVGLLSGLGAWAIGLPAPMAIGFFAGITEFIPILGPFIGAAPAVLLAVGESWQLALWTVLLFLAVQQVESNLISPLVQQHMTDIPPFLVLFGVIAFGLVFGIAGVIVAAPLTLVAYVLIAKLYVRDTLHQDIEIPGQEA